MNEIERLREIITKIKVKRTSINLQFNSIQKTLKDLEDWIKILESNL